MSQALEPTGVIVRHRVPGFSERWLLHEGTVPEAPWHYDAADGFARRASAGAERLGRPVLVLRNLAIRVLKQQPRVGFDPDVCWLEPPPPEGKAIDSLKLWLTGHRAPRLSLEIVSKSHPTKDYAEVPDQCAAVGVEELVVFDPKSLGPRTHGRRALLSVWRWADGAFERVEASEQPVKSVVLGAWLIPRLDPPQLLIADDPDGLRPWLTPEEAERAAKETERSAKEAALARVAELERELARRR